MRKGSKCSAETRAKISRALSGKNHPLWGKHHTEKTRWKISEGLKGNKNPLGAYRSEKTRMKISEALTGRTLSEEHCRNLSESHRGQRAWNKGKTNVYSDETLKRMSKAQSGEKHPQWKGGFEYHYGYDWYEERDKARKRDDYVCVCCELKENKRKHDTHHWIPYRLCHYSGLGNLVVLCRGCHKYIEEHFIIDFPETEVI